MDMNTLLPIIVQVIAGVIGGQAISVALKQAAMGQLTKILGGAVGGVGGALILDKLLGGGGAIDTAAAAAATSGLGSALNLNNIIGGAGGGAILTGILGAVMGAMKK
jgi:hypothetical protein